MIAKKKNIGKRVRWESQSRGSRTEKKGIIIGICPEGYAPRYFAPSKFPKHKIMFEAITPATIDTQRYFVEVKDGDRKPLLYYPKLADLIIDDEDRQLHA